MVCVCITKNSFAKKIDKNSKKKLGLVMSKTDFKLKTKEEQIEWLNQDLIYWNYKRNFESCPVKREEANNMLNVIQSEFERLSQLK